QKVLFEDKGIMDYQQAWDYQESLLADNVRIKSAKWSAARNDDVITTEEQTTHHLLFVEHPPVYTLGKSGKMDNVLLNEQQLSDKHLGFYRINRGGDVTFHGPGQLVAYPIFDLEKFYTDIGKYMRALEEVIILTLRDYGLKGERSTGETGVWLNPGVLGKERKICAIGIRCSRWITMHGFAFNVNTNLDYFNNIVPCGIRNKKVTSLQKELSQEVDLDEVKEKVKNYFKQIFELEFISP
ncbi:MAG: lipoyl(octanoyl) transferase LipB, partial [Flavitalea sp.]